MENIYPLVVIVEDDQPVRQGLCELIESAGIPVAPFADAHTFLDSTYYNLPGCLVLDLCLPDMSGLELQQHLKRDGVATPIIFISGFGSATSAATAIKAGAVDFIEKPFAGQTMLECVHQALAVDESLRKQKAAYSEIRQRVETLTVREQQVKSLIIAGKANKVIAAELGLSIKTIEAHRAKVMRKMKALSISQLVHLHHIEMSHH